MNWKLTRYNDINEYYSRVYPFLLRKEAEYNLPLGLVNSIKTWSRYKDPVLISVEDEGGVLKGVFIMTPPHHLVAALEVDEKDYGTIAGELHMILKKEGIEIPGVVSEKESAQRFTEAWCELKGCQQEIGMNQRVYKLDRVNEIELPEGKLVRPKEEDLPLLAKWIVAFTEETGVHAISPSEAIKRAEEMISNEKYLYFWEVEGKPVSMARGGRWTDNGITVNFVYTPAPHRKRGYASAVVSGLSRTLLEEFAFCTLYTDLENPTSNKIYMEIGYVPIEDSLMVDFK
ncbi:GNAT family N-acetyltransferase [Rossellomorea aquimaris]|uniref:GNAT family N-acetyltransferase n=1 Tax=Rossellomorea aquimaris TaxID=189382 RepID=UPI001CD3CBFD|nr:GNAT family N-acetyltransferase [Rossellomorea aquimaris]MCA1054473.1 GNAT family N-acetyltransferase [Rossellomorea aquimaris]